MITSHFPKNQTYQLFSPSLCQKDFITMPRLDPDLEKAGIDGKELFEFIYTHLDSWALDTYKNLMKRISDGEKINIYKLPFARYLNKGTVYEAALGYNGTYKSASLNTGTMMSQAKILCTSDNLFEAFTSGNYDIAYYINSETASNLSEARIDNSQWVEGAFQNDTTSFNQEDSIEIKEGVTGTLTDEGIVINGELLSNTKQITVVSKGTVAKVTGTFPINEVTSESGTHYSSLYGDNAFPAGRKIKFSPFTMSEFAVTAELYEKVMNSIKDFEGITKPSGAYINRNMKDGKSVCMFYIPNDVEDPKTDYVNNISYYDAVYFCNALTKLLLSEEDCVYSITKEERTVLYKDGINEGVTEEHIAEMCEAF